MLKKLRKVITDEPTTDYEAMLNFARVNDGEIVLAYTDGEKDVNLCEYIAKLAARKGCFCTAENVRKGESCSFDCDCEVLILNMVAIQAAELRERLKYYEDKENS
ncbi:MAG: hypothetical protein U0M12_02405 [Acutalibacteraceae bacterium]|nr:hypothetical protein [Acutalibacteraceae bacterium]